MQCRQAAQAGSAALNQDRAGVKEGRKEAKQDRLDHGCWAAQLQRTLRGQEDEVALKLLNLEDEGGHLAALALGAVGRRRSCARALACFALGICR